MKLDPALYILYLFISIFISSITAFLFWQRRAATGAKAMFICMLFAAQWTLSDLISTISSDMPVKLFWDYMTYLGVVVIPVAWIMFSLQYTGTVRTPTYPKIILLSIVPALTLCALWTNNYHHLFLKGVYKNTIGNLIITDPIFGPLFWVHAAYSYALIATGTLLLVKKLIRQPRIYRNQSLIMISGTITPFIGNIFFTFKLIDIPGFDPTMFFFSIAGLLYFFGMFRYKLFDLVPAAREAVIESMDELVLVVDTQSRIIDINAFAKKILSSIQNGELIGQPIAEILQKYSPEFLKYENILQTDEKISVESDGKTTFYNLRITPLYNIKGRYTGRFIIMRDITGLEGAIESLKVSQAAAENANKAKSSFLASMSHEIRTPLNAIIGMSELLTSANLTNEEKNYLLSVKSSANFLLDIVNDILDFSKIEAGKMELENIAFDVRNLMDSIFKTFMYQQKEKHLEFVCSIQDDIPEAVMGDPVRLRQVLYNLVSNAFKFTEKGSITVDVKKLKDSSEEVLIQFSVSDTGIGIQNDKIEGLFRSFEQLDSSTTRKYGGTGLGLAIVKNIITMMNGSITVESTPGSGSKFYFQIPFRKAAGIEKPSTTQEPEDSFTGKGIHVLLAEDNKTNQVLMSGIFKRKMFMVDVAGNGKKALEKFHQNTYDIVLMDIQMPEMDGYEATQSIRASEKLTGKHIPIIALTANTTEQDRERCIQAGMDDYISKPIKPNVLFECIRKYVS